MVQVRSYLVSRWIGVTEKMTNPLVHPVALVVKGTAGTASTAGSSLSGKGHASDCKGSRSRRAILRHPNPAGYPLHEGTLSHRR